METKDPAVLFYIADWLKSTAEMDADVRGWYLNLILHNYDKKDLPNDIEKLAVLCGVKFSEYKRFEQVFEQVLKQKFELTENNRLTNPKADNILRSRKDFKNKRSEAGKTSYIMKYMAKYHTKEYNNIEIKEYIKSNFDYTIDTKNEHLIKQMFKHLFELYINENENVIENKNITKDIIVKETKKDIPTENEFLDYCKEVLRSKYIEYEFSLISKYKTWIDDGWKTGHNKPIKNWKNTINNTIQYLKPIKQTENGQPISKTQNTINVINRLLAKHGTNTNQ